MLGPLTDFLQRHALINLSVGVYKIVVGQSMERGITCALVQKQGLSYLLWPHKSRNAGMVNTDCTDLLQTSLWRDYRRMGRDRTDLVDQTGNAF